MKKNIIKFPAFKHLKVNYKEITEEKLQNAYQALESNKAQVLTVDNDTVLFDKLSSAGMMFCKNQDIVILDEQKFEYTILVNNSSLSALSHSLLLKNGVHAKLALVCDLEEGDFVGGIDAKLEDNATLDISFVFLKGSNLVYNIHVDLLGEGSKVNLEGAYFCSRNCDYDINLEVNHEGRASESLLNVNGILDNGSKKTFKYCLDFKRGAVESKGSEQETVVALGDDFNNTTVPILLVGEDSIEASHGATLEEPDEKVLDYIYSRGIDKESAYFICVNAKFASALDMLQSEAKEYALARLKEIMRTR